MGAQDPASSRGPNYQVRALDRALDILDAFNLTESELTLTELAAAANLPVSTTKRLVSALEERSYLERSPETEQYRIGIRAFEIGSIYIQATTIEAEARPSLEWLVDRCQQTANLGVLNRGEVVHIAVVPPDRPIRYFATVGEREQAYCTGLGKALVAEFNDKQLSELVSRHPLVHRTRRTITSLDVFRIHLREIRDKGYAMDDEESSTGVRCVAAPIRNDRGTIVAAISISGPTFEFSEEVIPEYVEAVKQAAHEISSRLGYAIRPAGALEPRAANSGDSDNGLDFQS